MPLRKVSDPVDPPAVVPNATPKLIRDLTQAGAIALAQEKLPTLDAEKVATCVTEHWAEIEKFRVTSLASFVRSHLKSKNAKEIYYLGSSDMVRNTAGEGEAPNYERLGFCPYFVAGTTIQNYNVEGHHWADLDIRPGQKVTGYALGTGYALEDEGTGEDISDIEFYNALLAASWTPDGFVEHENKQFVKSETISAEGRVEWVNKSGLEGGIANFVITPATNPDWKVEARLTEKDFGAACLFLGKSEQAAIDAEDDSEAKAALLADFFTGVDVDFVIRGSSKADYKWNEFNGRTSLTGELIALIPRPEELGALDIPEDDTPEDKPALKRVVKPASKTTPKRATRNTPAPPFVSQPSPDTLDLVALRDAVAEAVGATPSDVDEFLERKKAELNGIIQGEDALLVLVAKDQGIDAGQYVKQAVAPPAKKAAKKATKKPTKKAAQSLPGDRLALAKRTIEEVAKLNPKLNWKFTETDWEEIVAMEGVMPDFGTVMPLEDFLAFCAEQRGETVPTVAEESPAEPPASNGEFTSEEYNAAYEALLSREPVSLLDWRKACNIPAKRFKAIVDALMVEGAVGDAPGGKYQSL